jgi:hypothetical protein
MDVSQEEINLATKKICYLLIDCIDLWLDFAPDAKKVNFELDGEKISHDYTVTFVKREKER